MTKLEQWAVELFRRAVEAYGGESIPGETECYAARVIQSAFEDRERKLREDAARYRWLRDASCPPHNFYISVPDEFHGVRYGPDEVDAYIDAARQALKETPDAG